MPDVTDDKQAIRREPPDKSKLRVFISYSRDDQDFTDQLDAALDTYGFDCVIDRHGIAGGEDWRRRLGSLISEADTVVFVVSPTSARSETCAWEVEQATSLGKRILPIICRPLEGASPPALLQGLNYIFFYAEPKVHGSGFGIGLQSLVAALNTDFDWLREHTRYLGRALEWNAGGRVVNRLLSGNDVTEAMAWLTRRPESAPEPTALQLDFIRASENEADARLNAERKQLEMIAAAQAERELALREREQALKEAASAQSKRVRVRNIALVAVSSLAVVAGLLGWRSEERSAQANRLLSGATEIIAVLHSQMDDESKKTVHGIFQTGAELGDQAAMRNLGTSYQFSIGVAQNYDKAREWYEKAADQGSTQAMTFLGLLYLEGLGVEKDYAKARQLFEKAADKGNTNALINLGLLYQSGRGVAQDFAKARQLYEEAADGGSADAMNNLGILYEKGSGGEQNYAKARELYEKATDKGSTVAMNNLGLLYLDGLGVEKDYAKARQLFEKGADKGDSGAMAMLGVLYQNGLGVEQDYAKARLWCEKAADKGDSSAMVNLGVLYHSGLGVEQNYAKARHWYGKATDQDNPRAMVNLGMIYANGLGVDKDLTKARELYEKAAAKGFPEATAMLEQLNIGEAVNAGRYSDALRLQEMLAARTEAEETKREGAPGKETAGALHDAAWYALFARSYAGALTYASRAHSLNPDNLFIETNRAHALMFLERRKEAEALYLAYKGKPTRGEGSKLWELIIASDFADLRKAGLTHPMMVDIEKKLGVSRLAPI